MTNKTEVKPSYTPGKWVAKNSWVWLPRNHPICIMDGEGFAGTDEAEANARLIAAAPELLKALKDLHEKCECQNEDESCVYLKIIKSAGVKI